MIHSGATCLAAMLALCAACSSSRAVELHVVMANGNCQQAHEGVTRVTLPEVAKLRGTQMLGMDSPEPDTGDVSAPFLIAIATGQKPTAGYALSNENATLEERTLVVRIHETAPAAGAMTAQVVTQPCLVLELPDGEFDAVRVIGEDGRVIGELER
jgi:hypothetical protein